MSAVRLGSGDSARRHPARRGRPGRRCRNPTAHAGRPGCARTSRTPAGPHGRGTRPGCGSAPGRGRSTSLIVGGTTQQWHLADLLGLRRVLDQLEHVGAAARPRPVWWRCCGPPRTAIGRPSPGCAAATPDRARAGRRRGAKFNPALSTPALADAGFTSGTLLGDTASTRFSV